MAGTNPDGTPPYDLFVSDPFFESFATVQTAYEAYKQVLSDVGAQSPMIDDHDVRVIEETLDGTTSCTGSRSGLPGLPDHEDDVGGYESYPEETRSADWDSDLDGLPDFWERLIGTSTSSGSGDFSDSNSDPDRNGYTALEEYLIWLADPHYLTTEGNTVTVDLAALFRGFESSPTYAVTDEEGGTASVSGASVTFSPSGCGLGSFVVTVTDADGDSMSRPIGVFTDTAAPGNCIAN
jgi:hypothetical protein